jgi:tRNA-Thr(GGU) m(6)t(6)A37 methyltransferase TsaA
MQCGRIKMSEEIIMTPIGTIHSPYTNTKDIPIQGKFKAEITAHIELKEAYTSGLKDLDGFSHAIILYYFHTSQKEHIVGKPFLEDKEHGIFSIRSPHHPNHIGLSIVKIERIEKNMLYFSEVDMLDQTPVLDIKPYVRYFDARDNTVSGWLERHFQKDESRKKQEKL